MSNRKGVRISFDDQGRIWRLHEAGYKNRQIGKIVGCSAGTVSNELKRRAQCMAEKLWR